MEAGCGRIPGISASAQPQTVSAGSSASAPRRFATTVAVRCKPLISLNRARQQADKSCSPTSVTWR
jgi:hypothetical protein